MICDICGITLGSENVIVVPPSVVVEPTHNGFVPSRLPPTWKKQLEQQLGIELGGPGVPAYHVAINAHWRRVVDGNASEDGGLCKACKEEIDLYVKKSTQSNQERSPNSSVVSHREEDDRKVNVISTRKLTQSNQQKSTNSSTASLSRTKKWWQFWR